MSNISTTVGDSLSNVAETTRERIAPMTDVASSLADRATDQVDRLTSVVLPTVIDAVHPKARSSRRPATRAASFVARYRAWIIASFGMIAGGVVIVAVRRARAGRSAEHKPARQLETEPVASPDGSGLHPRPAVAEPYSWPESAEPTQADRSEAAAEAARMGSTA